MVNSQELIDYLEHSLFDISKQSTWDFSGKQIFLGRRHISKVALSLDPTKKSILKAISEGCEVLITHHPLFFNGLKGVTISNPLAEKAILAIQNKLDIYSYHTNVDISPNGTNDYIAKLLGFETEAGFLSYEGENALYKISVFVPYDNKDAVFSAMAESHAGESDKYYGAAFISEGVGVFTPKDGSNPHIGEIGEKGLVDEVKIEMLVKKEHLQNVISAMLKVHPYEEPAYDIISLQNNDKYGFGKILRLGREYSLEEFASLVKKKLSLDILRSNMKSIPNFDRVALCTGSGASTWKDAKAKGVSVLLTGDLKHHDALDAFEAGVCILDATHHLTEEVFLNRLKEQILEKFQIEVKIYKEEPSIACL